MSHPLFILVSMWSWRRKESSSPTSTVAPVRSRACPDCADGLAHCHGTLVLHADGVLDCSEAVCRADPGLHAWWVPCIELAPRCGCVGDEHPLDLVSEAA
ncbi:MAG TPA: hypothetical protein VK988_07450 [Acidimicrobiales bacterium]|nr:hypothetical protein [Acidimicrobiales bacterium]